METLHINAHMRYKIVSVCNYLYFMERYQ